MQLELFGRLVRADLARLRASHSGAFVSSVLYDAGLIRDAATNGLVTVRSARPDPGGRRRRDGDDGLEAGAIRPRRRADHRGRCCGGS